MGASRGRPSARRGSRAGRALAACAAAALCALLFRGGGGAFALAPSAAARPDTAGRLGGLRGAGRSRARRLVARRALRLIGSQGSRSPLVNWYLHEIDQAFEMVDAGSVDRSSPGYPHPFGQIPALQDGDVKVFESGAILIYLAHKYGGLDSPELLAAVTKWIVWSNASLDPVVFIENEQGQVLDTGLRGSPKQINRLEQLLEGKKWILGDEFSVADVAIASYLLYGVMFFPDVNIGKWPNVARYMAAAAQRPAYARAFGERTAQTLAAKCQEAPEDGKLFGIF